MARNITFNGVTYTIPDPGDDSWGLNLSNYFLAIPQGALQKSGGTFTLSAEVDFGATYGLLVAYLKSRGVNPAAAGLIRLALADKIAWRNNANNADLALSINGSDQLVFNGNAIYPLGITALTGDVTATGPGSVASTIGANKVINSMIRQSAGLSVIGNSSSSTANVADIVASISNGVLTNSGTALLFALLKDANIDPAAAIAYSKLLLTGSIVNTDISSSAAISISKINTGLSGSLVGTSDTQTLTNKTFGDAVTISQIATPSAPASGKNAFYAKSDGNLYTLTSSGVEMPVGSGAGGGSKNYLGTVNNVNGNGNFELGSTSKWSLFNTTLTSLIPTGSITAGASSITTFGVVSSGQLAGSYSLETASSGVLTAGQGFISDAFTLDLEDRASVLAFSARYKTISGTMNFSGTSSNTWAVYIYDTSASAWLQPAGVYNLVQSSGVGKITGTFQPNSSTSTQYRLALICINSTAGATDMYWDDFTVGPQIQSIGPAASDTQDYTATWTGFGTPGFSQTNWSRIGDKMLIKFVMVSGTPTATEARLSLPNGLTCNINPGSSEVVGSAGFNVNGTAYVCVIATNGQSYVKFGVSGASSASALPANGNAILGTSGQGLVGYAIIPITGWSSNTVQSADTATNVVAAYTNGSSTSITTSKTTLVPTTIVKDTHAGFNGSGVYTVPVSGFYALGGTLNVTSSCSYLQLYYTKNSGTAVLISSNLLNSSAAFNATSGSSLLYLNAGDTIAFQAAASATVTADLQCDTSIYRLSGPAIIQATDTVAAKYTTTAGNSLSNGTIIDFATKSFDKTLAVTTGASWKFTAPVSGLYAVASSIQSGTFTPSAGNEYGFNVYKNGSLESRLDDWTANAAVSQTAFLQGSTLVQLNAGDYIDIRANVSSGTLTLNTFAGLCSVSIWRVGN